jgi:tetratricopeptide (TPR) repeat protein
MTADENFNLAKESISEYLTKITDDPRLADRDLEKLRGELLESGANFYKQLSERRSDDLGLKAERGLALRRLAEIEVQVAPVSQAIATQIRALEILKSVSAHEPSNERYRHWLGDSYSYLALLYQHAGDSDEAQELFDLAKEVFRDLKHKDSSNASWTFNLAKVISSEGLLRESVGNLQAARDAQVRAFALADKLPDENMYVRFRFLCQTRIAYYSMNMADDEKAEAAMGKARTIREELVKSGDLQADERYLFGLNLQNLAYLQFRQGRLSKAEKTYLQAREEIEMALKSHPGVALYQFSACKFNSQYGWFLLQASRTDDAKGPLNRALKLGKLLLDRDPEMADYQQIVADVHYNFGTVAYRLNELDAALENYLATMKTMEKLIAKYPSNVSYQSTLAWCYSDIAHIMARKSDLDAAIEVMRKSAVARVELASKFPEIPDRQYELSESYANLGRFFRQQKNYVAAQIEANRALPILEKLVGEHPTIFKYKQKHASCRWDIAFLYFLQNDFAAAAIEYEKTVAIYEQYFGEAENMPKVEGWPDVILSQYARMLRKSCDYVRAVAVWSNLQEKAPDSPLGYLGLAAIRAMAPDRQFRDGKRAIELAQKACDLDKGKHWELAYILAAAYAEVGDFEQAVAKQKEALDLSQEEAKELLLSRLSAFEKREAAVMHDDDPY